MLAFPCTALRHAVKRCRVIFLHAAQSPLVTAALPADAAASLRSLAVKNGRASGAVLPHYAGAARAEIPCSLSMFAVILFVLPRPVLRVLYYSSCHALVHIYSMP